MLELIQRASQQSLADQLKMDARKKWLNAIQIATGRSISNMEPIYRAVFQAILKDAEMHGGGKSVSISILVMEKSAQPDAKYQLRCVAAFPQDEAKFMVDQVLTEDKPNLSFKTIATGRPLVVPNLLASITNFPIYFWSEAKRNQLIDFVEKAKDAVQTKPSWFSAACATVPIESCSKRIFGVLCVDTCREKYVKTGFSNNEGVAKCFSQAYFQVGTWRKFTRLLGSGFTWLSQRASSSIVRIDFYFTQPLENTEEETELSCFSLSHLVSCQNRSEVTVFAKPKELVRKECLFM
ncbi:EF-hand calcium-binding domain-containing protein 5 [Cichlidogyrus casuarinus]|uniref:EF-hand calcium-binding domain-containing protein 5 n=1 Tax=Cichlidogyrus casuarinus TaxID=1844966 RepID=A0ABD2PX14_9PLAT